VGPCSRTTLDFGVAMGEAPTTSGSHFRLSMILTNVLLVNTWILRPGYANAVNAASWTLDFEALFYLLMPFRPGAPRISRSCRSP
jgi:peptidoglycan/LPS O-acetylase OafA/YrhL